MRLSNPEECPKCRGEGKVIETGKRKAKARVRRRECKDCLTRWNTFEITEADLKTLQTLYTEPRHGSHR